MFFLHLMLFYLELIDTLWNVNVRSRKKEAKGRDRINRYIMECKFYLRHLRYQHQL